MGQVNKVLLIDDDNITNFLNARIIKKLNISQEIQIANNGEEALNYLKSIRTQLAENRPLILLDINMPIMNGIDFLQTLDKKASFQYIPNIIVLSTSTNSSDMAFVRTHPAVLEVITKPLTEAKLESVMKKHFAFHNHSSKTA